MEAIRRKCILRRLGNATVYYLPRANLSILLKRAAVPTIMFYKRRFYSFSLFSDLSTSHSVSGIATRQRTRSELERVTMKMLRAVRILVLLMMAVRMMRLPETPSRMKKV